MCRDRSAEVCNASHVNPIGHDRFDDPVSCELPRGRNRDRPDSGNPARLSGDGATALPGRMIHLDMNDTARAGLAVAQRQERVGRMCLEWFALPRAARIGCDLVCPSRYRSHKPGAIVGREPTVEPHRSIAVAPMPQITASPDSLVCILIRGRGGANHTAFLPQLRHGRILGQGEKRGFRSRVGRGRSRNLRGLHFGEPAGNKRRTRGRKIRERTSGVQGGNRVGQARLGTRCHPLRSRPVTGRAPGARVLDAAGSNGSGRRQTAFGAGKHFDEPRRLFGAEAGGIEDSDERVYG